MAKFKNLFFTFLITLSIGFYSCDEDVPVEAGNLTEEDIQNAFDQAKAEKEGGDRTDEEESNSDDTNNDDSDNNSSDNEDSDSENPDNEDSDNENTNEEITISTEDCVECLFLKICKGSNGNAFVVVDGLDPTDTETPFETFTTDFDCDEFQKLP